MANWRATSPTVAPTLEKLVAFGKFSYHLLGGVPFRLHVLHSSVAYFEGTFHITGGLVFWEPLTYGN